MCRTTFVDHTLPHTNLRWKNKIKWIDLHDNWFEWLSHRFTHVIGLILPQRRCTTNHSHSDSLVFNAIQMIVSVKYSKCKQINAYHVAFRRFCFFFGQFFQFNFAQYFLSLNNKNKHTFNTHAKQHSKIKILVSTNVATIQTQFHRRLICPLLSLQSSPPIMTSSSSELTFNNVNELKLLFSRLLTSKQCWWRACVRRVSTDAIVSTMQRSDPNIYKKKTLFIRMFSKDSKLLLDRIAIIAQFSRTVHNRNACAQTVENVFNNGRTL